MAWYRDQFVVLVKSIEEETEQRRQELESQQQDIQTIIDTITDHEEAAFPSSCDVDTATGAYNHRNSECPVNSRNLSSRLTCPFKELDEIQHSLRGLELRKLLTLCFHNPEYAKEQYILSGLAQGSSIYKYS